MPLGPLRRLRSWSPLDLAFVAVAITLTAASGGRFASALAARVTELPLVEASLPVVALPSEPTPRPAPAEELAATVSLAPFAVDRSPPRVRYRPDLAERGRMAEATERDRTRIPEFRLRGTAIHSSTRLALIERSSGQPGLRLYRSGDQLDRFVLKTVAADSAVLESADTTFVLRIERPWKNNAH